MGPQRQLKQAGIPDASPGINGRGDPARAQRRSRETIVSAELTIKETDVRGVDFTVARD